MPRSSSGSGEIHILAAGKEILASSSRHGFSLKGLPGQESGRADRSERGKGLQAAAMRVAYHGARVAIRQQTALGGADPYPEETAMPSGAKLLANGYVGRGGDLTPTTAVQAPSRLLRCEGDHRKERLVVRCQTVHARAGLSL